jgi:hypothetical protein
MANLVLNTPSNPGSAVWTDISALVPGQTLAQTLVFGNVTGGTNLVVTSSDVISGVASVVGSNLPGSKLELRGGAGDGTASPSSVTITVDSLLPAAIISFTLVSGVTGASEVLVDLYPDVSQDSGFYNYNETLGTVDDIASSIADAINDPGNVDISSLVTAVATGSTITVTTIGSGSVFNNNSVISDSVNILPDVPTNFSGGIDAPLSGPVIISSSFGSIQSSNLGNARGLNAIDLQMYSSLVTQVAGGDYAVILGGANNIVSGTLSTALASEECTLTSTQNLALSCADTQVINNSSRSGAIESSQTVIDDSNFSFVLNGNNVTLLTSDYTNVFGSFHNITNSSASTVSGISNNATNASYSSVTGYKNVVEANFTRAAGHLARARYFGEDVYAANVITPKSVAGSAQRVQAIWQGQVTTDPTILTLGGSGATYDIPLQFNLTFEMILVARCVQGLQSGSVAGFRLNGVAKNIGGVTTIVASTVTSDGNDFAPPLVAPSVVVSGTAIAPQVAGLGAGNTINYVVIMTGSLVSGQLS